MLATTGTITIPLMKRTGYKVKEFAGPAVEAVASTGWPVHASDHGGAVGLCHGRDPETLS